VKKRIHVDQLRVGMYVHDLNCSWIDHPFLWNQFLLKTDAQLDAILKTGVEELVIDTERGLDAAIGRREQDVAAETDRKLQEIARTAPARVVSAGLGNDDPVLVAPPVRQGERCKPLEAEMDRARRLQESAQALVQDVYRGALDNAQVNITEVETLAIQLSTSLASNAGALSSLVRLKDVDFYTFQHSVAVGVLLMGFARSLGLSEDEVTECGVGGLLHDIGKMYTPSEILNKPGKLTPEEFAVIKKHPGEGYAFLRENPGVREPHLDIVHQHHERLDGSGYPQGLDDARLGRYARMSAIVDIYDALTSDRCYHKGQAPTLVLRRLVEWSGSHLDRDLVQAFIRFVGIYPTGSWVMLESGRIAIVTEQNESSLLAPSVLVVYDAARRQHLSPRAVTLSADAGGDDRIKGVTDPERYGLVVSNYL